MGFGKSDFVFSLEGYIKILLLVFGSVLYILAAVNLSSFNQNFRASFSSWNVDLPFELRLNAIQGPSDLSKLQSLQQQKPLYEMGYRAWEGVFMGVKAGCYCASGDSYHEMDPGFFEKPCNSSQLDVGCRDSRPIPETKLKYWDSNEIISIGGIKGANFIKLSQNMNSDGSCKSGMRKCSANHPVSKGLCVPAEWNACPITDLKVGSGDQSFNTSIKLRSNALLSYSTSSMTENPWAEFTMAEFQVCKEKDRVAMSPGRTPHRMLVAKPFDCTRDHSYVELLSQGEPTLFSANRIDTSDPWDFTSKDSYKWFLFSKRLLAWSPLCLEYTAEIVALQPKVNEANDINFILIFITGFFSLVLFCMIQTDVNTAYKTEKTNEDYEFIDRAQRYRTPVAVVLFCLVFYPTVLVLPVMWTLSLVRECSDSETNMQLVELHSSSRGGIFCFMCVMLFAVTFVCVTEVYFLCWKILTKFSPTGGNDTAELETGPIADML